MTRKAGPCALIVLLAVLSAGLPVRAERGRSQIEKPKIFQDSYPIVSDSDFLCSFFVLEAAASARIEGAEASDGMTLIGEGELVWARGADGEDVRPGQVFAVIEPSEPTPGAKPGQGPGPIAFRRGRLRVVRLDGPIFLGRIEKACGTIRAGCLLLPYEEKAPILGRDLGYNAVFKGGETVTGRLSYFRDGLVQAGPGDWILIDIGGGQGLQAGQQLTVFSKPEGDRPPRAAANVVIVDVGLDTATVKVLSAREALHVGDLVQVKEPRGD
jgi:hypothetical protein